MSDLREMVAALYQEKWGVSDMWLADAAIALVLEEAAKAVAEKMYLVSMGSPEQGPFTRQDQIVDEIVSQAAAAIRALGDKA